MSLCGNDFRHWKGYILGPEDTVYHGGLFQIDIALPPEYPYKPPKMRFETKIWHPNISSQTGAICLDILKVRDPWTLRDIHAHGPALGSYDRMDTCDRC